MYIIITFHIQNINYKGLIKYISYSPNIVNNLD